MYISYLLFEKLGHFKLMPTIFLRLDYGGVGLVW